MGYNTDAIERQLAHTESNKIHDAYTHAAQYLDALKAGGKVLPMTRKAG